MVFQTERAEQKQNITLERLERMARALGCDLVYGLVAWKRSLDDHAMELVEREVWRKRYPTFRLAADAIAASPLSLCPRIPNNVRTTGAGTSARQSVRRPALQQTVWRLALDCFVVRGLDHRIRGSATPAYAQILHIV